MEPSRFFYFSICCYNYDTMRKAVFAILFFAVVFSSAYPISVSSESIFAPSKNDLLVPGASAPGKVKDAVTNNDGDSNNMEGAPTGGGNGNGNFGTGPAPSSDPSTWQIQSQARNGSAGGGGGDASSWDGHNADKPTMCSSKDTMAAFFEKCIMASVTELFLKLAAYVAELSGKLLDISINYSLNIGANATLMATIDSIWTTFRDIANMFFIFALLYIAFATMLQVNGFQTKQILTKLIIIGLLLNFSLFFTKVIIDFSNVLAYNFYTAISGNVVNDKATITHGGKPIPTISGRFINQLGLKGIYTDAAFSATGQAGGATDNERFRQIWKVMLFGAIFLFILAFIFLAGAIMFIIRTVMLLFLMLFSPLAFIAYILPGTKQYGDMWFNRLVSEAFFAPAFLLLVWATAKIMADFNKNRGDLISGGGGGGGGGGGSTYTFNNNLAAELTKLNSLDIVFAFTVIIGLMIASLVIAKQMGSTAGSMSVSIAQRATRFGGKNTIGAAGSLLALMGSRLNKSGYRSGAALGALGRGLRDRSYDVGKLPFAKNAGMDSLKDSKGVAQMASDWWKSAADRQKKAYGDIKGGDENANRQARTRYLSSLGDKDLKNLLGTLSAGEIAELRVSDANLKNKIDTMMSAEKLAQLRTAEGMVKSKDTAGVISKAKTDDVALVAKKSMEEIAEIAGKQGHEYQGLAAAIQSLSTVNTNDLKKVDGIADKMAHLVPHTSPAQFKDYTQTAKLQRAELTKLAHAVENMKDGGALHRNEIEAGRRTSGPLRTMGEVLDGMKTAAGVSGALHAKSEEDGFVPPTGN